MATLMVGKDASANDRALLLDSSGALIMGTGSTDSTSATVTSIASLATSQTIAVNASRKAMTIVNTDPATLYLKYGATVTTALYSYAVPNGVTWEMPERYTGAVSLIWAADGAGAALVTETV